LHLSRGAYYADFFVLPIVGLALAGGSLFRANLVQSLIWGIICLSGVVTWTLLEYVLHRYVLHHVPGFEQMHDAHHADPLASVGAPIWVTLPMLCLCGLLPLWWPVGFLQASGLTTGWCSAIFGTSLSIMRAIAGTLTTAPTSIAGSAATPNTTRPRMDGTSA